MNSRCLGCAGPAPQGAQATPPKEDETDNVPSGPNRPFTASLTARRTPWSADTYGWCRPPCLLRRRPTSKSEPSGSRRPTAVRRRLKATRYGRSTGPALSESRRRPPGGANIPTCPGSTTSARSPARRPTGPRSHADRLRPERVSAPARDGPRPRNCRRSGGQPASCELDAPPKLGFVHILRTGPRLLRMDMAVVSAYRCGRRPRVGRS